jgi:putative nucleotidyltransferase with HDIG domain
LAVSNPGIHLGRASRVKSLPPFSPAACKLIQLINDESMHFREVSQVLAVDASLSGQVLRVANSALLGCRYEIASILQALFVVGADRLRDIVITVAIHNYMGRSDNAFLHRCWRHNLATALWCERLAEHCDVDRPIAYTAGILHDIGRVALLKLFPHEYATFMDRTLTGDRDRLQAERSLYDADHCQIGQTLADSWSFPPVLRDVIGCHHDEFTHDAPRPRLLVQAACTAASIGGFPAVCSERAWAPAQIDSLLPSRRVASPLNYHEILEAVALKLNQTECSLL